VLFYLKAVNNFERLLTALKEANDFHGNKEEVWRSPLPMGLSSLSAPLTGSPIQESLSKHA
jgi:hypothetical protein